MQNLIIPSEELICGSVISPEGRGMKNNLNKYELTSGTETK